MKKLSGLLIATTAATLIISGKVFAGEKKEKTQKEKTIRCEITEKTSCGGAGGCGGHAKKKTIETTPKGCQKKGGKIIGQ